MIDWSEDRGGAIWIIGADCFRETLRRHDICDADPINPSISPSIHDKALRFESSPGLDSSRT
jgi:hypothetical protein